MPGYGPYSLYSEDELRQWRKPPAAPRPAMVERPVAEHTDPCVFCGKPLTKPGQWVELGEDVTLQFRFDGALLGWIHRECALEDMYAKEAKRRKDSAAARPPETAAPQQRDVA